MESFERARPGIPKDEYLDILIDCIRISMKQYLPQIKTVQDVEDNIDMETMYIILDIAAGIKMNKKETEEITTSVDSSSSSLKWSEMDIVGLESELFLIGKWKDYDELESSLSMQELTITLNAKRDQDYKDKKFQAALQGVDLDKQTGKTDENAWEKLKAKVFSKGKTTDPKDIVSLQGAAAQRAGFGIGMGLAYEDLTKN